MKRYICLVPLLAALCAGCSALPSLFAPANEDPDPATAAAVAPPVPGAQPPAEQFCARVAAGVQARAMADGFDAATQERMRQQAYRQCAVTPG